MPYFTHQGARLYYEEHGCGRALVFLHGASWDLRQWQEQVEHFSPYYRVVTMDARGHGRSTLPPGEVSPELFWQDARALLDHLKITTAILCGLSLGGHTALQLAIHAPERVEKLILIGTPCTNRFNWYERIAVPVNRFCLRLLPMSWIAWSLAAVLGQFNPEAKQYMRQVVSAWDHDAFNRVWRAVTSMESRPGLAGVQCPALLLIGDHDTMTGRQQQFLYQSIAGSQLVTIARAHHATNLDNPQQVEQQIKAFLAP